MAKSWISKLRLKKSLECSCPPETGNNWKPQVIAYYHYYLSLFWRKARRLTLSSHKGISTPPYCGKETPTKGEKNLLKGQILISHLRPFL